MTSPEDHIHHTPRTPRGLRALIAQPRASWGSYDDVKKIVLYTRWSAHFFMLIIASLGALGWYTSRGRDEALGTAGIAPVLTVIASGVVCAAVAIAVLELVPQFNVEPRRPVGPFILLASVVHVVTWVAGIGLYILAEGWEWALVGILIAGAAAICFTWGVAPWLKKPWVVAILVGVATDAILWRETGFFHIFMALMGVMVMNTSEWIVQVLKDLKKARDTEAALQVSEERLRFAQELHDTLGQHLAAISLKAQVARALAQRNDERLDGELQELQQLASQSSDEMRQVVRGYRAVNLATELSGARKLLETAGIEVEVTGMSTDIPEVHRDLCAWLVRESATNILRHSSASQVAIRLSGDGLRITNDGANPDMNAPGGLQSLQRKAEENGAHLLFSPVGDATRGPLFVVECAFPQPAGASNQPDGASGQTGSSAPDQDPQNKGVQ